MNIEIHYFADDGTEFDTEQECLAYEAVFKEQLDAVVWMTDSIRPCEDMEEVESLGTIMYIKDGEKANALFEHLGDYISFDKLEAPVHTGDILEWGDDGWFNLRSRVLSLTKHIEEIEKEVAALADC